MMFPFARSSCVSKAKMRLETPSDRHHKRSHSWPPFRIHHDQPKQDIDENPFAFFVSVPETAGAVAEDSLAAGIEEKARARSLSPFLTRRRTVEPDLAALTAESHIAKLKKWILKMEQRYFNHKVPNHIGVPENSPASPLQRSPGSPQLRGRGNIRGSPRTLASRVQGTRSHSAKPRAWREPSEDMWPVPEEQDEVGLGISM